MSHPPKAPIVAPQRHMFGVQRRVQQRFFGLAGIAGTQLRHEPDGNLRT